MKPYIAVFLIALVCAADSEKTDNGLVKQNSETSDDPAVHDVGIAGIPYPGALYPAAANALYPAAKYPAALYGGAVVKAVYPVAAKALYPAAAKAVYPAAANALYPAAKYPAALYGGAVVKAVYPAAAKALYPAAAKAVYPAAANALYPAAKYPAALYGGAAAKAVYPAAPLYGAGLNAGLAPYYKDSEDLLTIRDDQLHEDTEKTGRSNEPQNTVPSKISLRSSDPMENENTSAGSRQADNTSDHFAKTAGNSGYMASCPSKTSPQTMAENNTVHTMISESCTTQSLVEVSNSTLGEASTMKDTVSTTLPAAVTYHMQSIELDAVADYEMHEADQTSLLSFPENSTGISCNDIDSPQTLIEPRCESKQDDDLHPAISSGDFDRVVKLKSERKLTDTEKYVLLKRQLQNYLPKYK
ncbi:hypothetical protein EMCRGX_G022745 [Ephydatia muelleri]